jgi:hypothetical protein
VPWYPLRLAIMVLIRVSPLMFSKGPRYCRIDRGVGLDEMLKPEFSVLSPGIT